MTMQNDLEKEINRLKNELELANNRMSAANHTLLEQVNSFLELRATHLALTNNYNKLNTTSANFAKGKQDIIDQMQKTINALTTENSNLKAQLGQSGLSPVVIPPVAPNAPAPSGFLNNSTDAA